MIDFVNLINGGFMAIGGLFFAWYIFRTWKYMIKKKLLRPVYLYVSVITALIAIYIGASIAFREIQKVFP